VLPSVALSARTFFTALPSYDDHHRAPGVVVAGLLSTCMLHL
jgi:hypothetical protein